MKVLARRLPGQSGHFLQVLPSTEWIPQNNRSNITSHCCTFTMARWRNLAQLPQVMVRDTKKVIQSVKFHISHQMKPYPRVKAICRSS